MLLLMQQKILKFTDELPEELYKPVPRKFQRKRVNVNGIDEIGAADLIDMQAFSNDNNGIKYLPTVIDIYFKFVWIVPLKQKTGQEVANAFSRILLERRPSKMSVDKGREFNNKDVQKQVELYSTENEEKSCVIERFNRTIKEIFVRNSLLIIQEHFFMYLTDLQIRLPPWEWRFSEA